MTSTITGLPDRYRLLDEVGPEEQTSTGVIRGWRATDRVLDRDVTVRVHTPSGSAAHEWITRALTAGGLATPALAMVYDAAEGTDPADGRTAPGGASYVVNEWIDGDTLAARLADGPLPERDLRPMMRRLADAVAEAHRVGLALGGLTAGNVVLRPNGLVAVRAVPAATGTMEGDIAALGDLLEACLTGRRPEDAGAPPSGPPDLLALARRARSTAPGQGLSSVAAMAALLAERPRAATGRGEEGEGRRRRTLDRKAPQAGGRVPQAGGRRAVDPPTRVATAPPGAGAPAGAAPTVAVPPAGSDPAPRQLDPQARPPVPPSRSGAAGSDVPPAAAGNVRRGDTVAVPVPAADDDPVAADARDDALDGYGPLRLDDDPDAGGLDDGTYEAGFDEFDDDDEDGARPRRELTAPSARRRMLVIGLPLVAALLVVIALAWWFGARVLSVAGSYDDVQGSTPSAGAPAGTSASEEADASEEAPATGGPVQPASASVFDPGGDGAPENDDQVPLSFDGDPATAWSTLTYRGAPEFGNLKDGVGVVYDLGSPQVLAGVTLATTQPGSAVEVRAASGPDGSLDEWPVLAGGRLEQRTDLTFDEQVETQYVLVWLTELVPAGDGFSADLAEVTLVRAG